MLKPDDCQTLQAWFDGVQDARDQANAEWGVDRLPLLVSDETRAKFYRQSHKWGTAYRAAWEADMLTRAILDDVTATAGGMRRAYAAMTAEAVEAGHRPLSPEVWETTLEDGTVAAIVRTDAEAGHVIASGRALVVYSLAEIATVIDALPKALQDAKRAFPGAHVQSPRDTSWVKLGDPIPF